jgi:hypothetical protein
MLFRRGGNRRGNSPHTVLHPFTFPHPPTLRLRFRNLDFDSETSSSIPELQLLSRTFGSCKGNPPLHHIPLLLVPISRPRFQSLFHHRCCFVVPLCIAIFDAFRTHSGMVLLFIIFYMLPCKVQQVAFSVIIISHLYTSSLLLHFNTLNPPQHFRDGSDVFRNNFENFRNDFDIFYFFYNLYS